MIHVLRFAARIDEAQARPADVILFRFGRAFSHGAILVDGQQVIHAVMKDGAVVLGDLDRDVDLADRERMVFSFWAAAHGG